ncbi:hypothetical protein SUGI_0777940 [Cryptomeria japonica]|nr:hypothetical protein SUGI_0777940 [Cryptomeria japonica]
MTFITFTDKRRLSGIVEDYNPHFVCFTRAYQQLLGWHVSMQGDVLGQPILQFDIASWHWFLTVRDHT